MADPSGPSTPDRPDDGTAPATSATAATPSPASTAPPGATAAIAASQRPHAAPTVAPESATTTDPGEDWPAKVTDLIVEKVDLVRDNTTGRAVTAVRGVKFGLVIAPLAIVVGILAVIMLLRISEAILAIWITDPMWIVYLGYGALFSAVGLLLWRKGNQATANAL